MTKGLITWSRAVLLALAALALSGAPAAAQLGYYDAYDYYDVGYDDDYTNDWYYDWYDYDLDAYDGYYDYYDSDYYDYDADLFDWEEDGLFN